MSDKKFDEYPKALTIKRRDSRGFLSIVPIMRHGQPVIFANKDEEQAYDGGGEVHTGAPEQHSQPSYDYHCYFRV